MPESQLFWNEEKRRFEVEITNRKGEKKKITCDDSELSADLPKTLPEEPVEVEFERNQHGDPIKIRPLGKEWAASQKKPTQIDYSRKTPVPHSDRSKLAGARDIYSGPHKEEAGNMPCEFHNPYNFVPAPERVMKGGLGDGVPCGHDRYYSDKYSGKLHVKMRVETPLLLPDTARMHCTNNQEVKEHKSYPVRVAADSKPSINPTAIKGMLRSAYEAITNSRLSVFKGHDEQLAFRMESTEGAMSVPARIENGKIVLYTGTSEISDKGRPLNERGEENNATLCAAWLPMNKTQRHGKKLFAWLEKMQHINKRSNKPDFKYWRVHKLAASKADLGNQPVPSRETRNQSLEEFIEVEGFVCNTGKNIINKHDERFFFIYGKDEDEIIKIDFDKQTHGVAWERLIKSYRQEHSEKNGELKAPPEAERFGGTIKLEWSRHIQRTEFSETSKDAVLRAENLANSPLCYARVRKEHGDWKVEELYPVTISRRLHKTLPEELLDECLKPATNIEKLSPADRVFGWVGQNMKRKTAYRGQIRIGMIDCISDKADAIASFSESIPLQILGQPKPQQGRFYVAKDKDGNAQAKIKNNEQGLTNEQAGYNDEAQKGLRGRKIYPHHAKTVELKDEYGLPKYWDITNDYRQDAMPNGLYQEYRRPKDMRDSQNRSIKGWVKRGTLFEFDIHFINLSEVELGALLWLLNLEPDQFHRFGGGKPLGFGSVHLRLNDTEICRGETLKKRYESLDEVELKLEDPQSLTNKFKEAIEEAYGEPFNQVLFIRAFLKAASGFDKPIHYPRTSKDPNPEGESFKWFVANSKIKRGSVRYGFALPNLWEDEGLPILPNE